MKKLTVDFHDAVISDYLCPRKLFGHSNPLDSIDKKIDLVGVFINYFFYVSFITSNLASFLVISSSSGQVCSTCIACS